MAYSNHPGAWERVVALMFPWTAGREGNSDTSVPVRGLAADAAVTHALGGVDPLEDFRGRDDRH